MKVLNIFKILFLGVLFSFCVINCAEISSSHKTTVNNFSTKLWTYGNLDSIESVSNADDEFLITKSSRGVISKINKDNKEVVAHKNYYLTRSAYATGQYNKYPTVYSYENYIVNIQTADYTVEVLNKNTLELLHSFSFNSEPIHNALKKAVFNLRIELFFFKTTHKKFNAVLFSESSVIYFNDKEVIDEMYFDSSEEVIMDYYVDGQEILERNNQMVKKNELDIQLLIINRNGKNEVEKVDSEQENDEEKQKKKNSTITAVVEIRKFTLKLKSSEENAFNLRKIEKYPSLIDKKFKKLYDLYDSRGVNKQNFTYQDINSVIMHTLPTFKWKLSKNYIFAGVFFSYIKKWTDHVNLFVEFGINVKKLFKLNKSIVDSDATSSYEKIFITHKDEQKGTIHNINLEQTIDIEISMHTEKIMVVNQAHGIFQYSKYEGKEDVKSCFFIEKYIFNLHHKDNLSTCKSIEQAYLSKAYMGSTKNLDNLYRSKDSLASEDLPQDYLYVLMECNNDKYDIMEHLYTKMIIISMFKETDNDLPYNVHLEDLTTIKQDRSQILNETNAKIESQFFKCDLNNFYPHDYTDYFLDCKNSGIMKFKFNQENLSWTMDELTDLLRYKKLLSFNYDDVSDVSSENIVGKTKKSEHKITNIMDIINVKKGSKNTPNIFANMFSNMFHSSKRIYNNIQNSINKNLDYYKLINTNTKDNKNILPKNSAFMVLSEWFVVKIYEINTNTLVFTHSLKKLHRIENAFISETDYFTELLKNKEWNKETEIKENNKKSMPIGPYLYLHLRHTISPNHNELIIISLIDFNFIQCYYSKTTDLLDYKITDQVKNSHDDKVIYNDDETILNRDERMVYTLNHVNELVLDSRFKAIVKAMEEGKKQIDIKNQVKTKNSGSLKSISTNLNYISNKNYILAQYDGSVNTLYGINFALVKDEGIMKDHKNSELKVKLSISWSLNVSNLKSLTTSNINKNTSGIVASQGKIFHKYLNPNLILIISKSFNPKNTVEQNYEQEVGNVLVEIIDSSNGKILKKYNLEKVNYDTPIFHVFEDNHIFISYNKQEKTNLKQEILSIEILKRNIDDNFVDLMGKILKKNFFNKELQSQSNSHFESHNIRKDYYSINTEPVFLSHTYVLVKMIKNLAVSKSNLNIANKALLIVYTNNLISIMDFRNVSARRPIMSGPIGQPQQTPAIDTNNANSAYVDYDLPAYSPLFMIDYKNIVSKNYLNNQVNDILITNSTYESSFFLCTFGLGIECYKISPDKTFDTLSDNFNYPLIALFLVVTFIFTFGLRKHVKDLEFKNSFLRE